ncbi:hypothetical protein [Methylocapsa sp. S129]|uniref:hypothetical protein n=1 Tax=Methylocapsa sp. S129 TaxID=1641869 RepID=UPI00131DFAD6|nr:hypothetical protein [Methylocapsa sp. S129]
MTVNLVIAVAWFAPIPKCALAEFRLQQTRQKMVSTTVLSRLTLTDLEPFHKSPRAVKAHFLRPR